MLFTALGHTRERPFTIDQRINIFLHANQFGRLQSIVFTAIVGSRSNKHPSIVKFIKLFLIITHSPMLPGRNPCTTVSLEGRK